MAAPKFKFVQGVSAWASGSVTEFSTTVGSGDVLGAILGAINYSSNIGPTGPQTTNAWTATFPVAIGLNSYEFIWGLYVTSPSDNNLVNMRVWVPPFSPIAGCTFYIGTDMVSGFAAPTDATSLKALTDFATITSQASGYVAVGPPANVVGGLSDPIWVQVATGSPAVGGNQTGMPLLAISIDWS